MTTSRLLNRNVYAQRGRTSIRLEPELWSMLKEICEREALDMGALVSQIDLNREVGGRTSAVRVYIANYFRHAATEAGHIAVGHGSLK